MLLMDIAVGTNAGFCRETIEVWQFIGVALLVFKIVIPVILIILGMVDLGKAVISSDDKSIGKAVKSVAFRVIAAVVIFFIPTLIGAVFSLIGSFGEAKDDFKICKECITSPINKKGTCQQIINPDGTTPVDEKNEG